jgi:hypothetical protein
MSQFSISLDDYCLTTGDVAAYLKLSQKTLRTYRCDRLGPAFLKLGRNVRL